MTTILEDQKRRSDGRDKGAILVTYAAPPETAVINYLKDNINLTGLQDRQIDCPVIQGHPLFQEGISEAGFDSMFPKVGVEWVRDHRTEFLGMSEGHFKNNEDFRNKLNHVSQQFEKYRMPPQRIFDEFMKAKNFQKFSWKVNSEIVICGFDAGNIGRKNAHWIYEVIDGLLPLLANDLPHIYQGVAVTLSEDAEPSLSSTDFARPVFGFEVKLFISQIKTVFRTKPDFLFGKIKKIDVHLEKSRTELNLNSFDKGNFDNR